MTQVQSLFERIGGADAMPSLVEQFYGRVLKDPELKPFFSDASMEKLKHMQVEFLSAALGGPVHYEGSPIRRAHRHLKISLANYQRFTQHLFAALADYKLSEQECYGVIFRLDVHTNDIVTKDVDPAP